METGWTIFISHVILSEDRGYLYGTINIENKTICILDVCKNSEHQNRDLVDIGVWTPFKSKEINDTLNNSKNPWIHLLTNSQDYIDCVLKVDKELTKCTCVLYNPRKFQESYFFMEKAESHSLVRSSTLDDVYHSLLLVSSTKPGVTTYGFIFIFKLLEWFLIYSGLIFLAGLFLKICEKLCQRCPWVYRSLSDISCLSQLYKRAEFIISSRDYDKQSPVQKLRYQNRIWSQVVDCILGVLFLLLFWHFDLHNKLIILTVHWTNDVAERLIHLIYWLMGAPAGLKLNLHLTQLMGQFFLYHVYIWTGYVGLIQPVLLWMSYLAVPISILGLSLQLSLVQSVMSLLTLHIYCFYVYAARIYSLEISCLGALWRLFRGKKWNILRERVDSASYDFEQLFFGTLIFTILLFLLPTILLYYSVFLVFRLLILSFHGVISCCVELINTSQIYSIVSWFLKSKSITGDVIFTTVPNGDNKNILLLSLQTSHLPLHVVLKTRNSEKQTKSTLSCLSFIFSRIIYGHLLYPWISPSNYKIKLE